ncbi:MAG: hypothetical protein QNJ04_04210 [Desulfobacterales bacterium]|nr:hypothetical protein [Desulfobacterales bacterium]
MTALTLLLVCVITMHVWICVRSRRSGRVRALLLAIGLVIIGLLTGFIGILVGLGGRPTAGRILLTAPFVFAVLSFLPYTALFRRRPRK